MRRQYIPEDEPLYSISVAARIIGVHAQTLRHYERAGLLTPSRSSGRIRLYSQIDINRLRQIQRLINDLGVNLAGAEVIIRLTERLQQLELALADAERELQKLRRLGLPAPQ